MANSDMPVIREDPDKWLFNQLNDRVKDLESDRVSSEAIGNMISDVETRVKTNELELFQRVKYLEQHDSHLTVKALLTISTEHNERLKALEEWKENNDKCNDEFVQNKRLTQLEEWKRNHQFTTEGNVYRAGTSSDALDRLQALEEKAVWSEKMDFKVIDKKVWEEIKQHAADLTQYWNVELNIKYLKEAIKKADK